MIVVPIEQQEESIDPSATYSVEVEIPGSILSQVQAFLDRQDARMWDQNRLVEAALSLFLAQQSVSVNDLLESVQKAIEFMEVSA